jgi:hypothetical protein
MTLTKLEAKERTVKFWTYAKDHPKIWRKDEFPPKIYALVKGLNCGCPLCEVSSGDCSNCPLFLAGEDCHKSESSYRKWCRANRFAKDGLAKAREAAGRIVEITKAWEVKE